MTAPPSAATNFSLQKARKLIAEASRMLDAELTDAAGRDAYLAAFHATRALTGHSLGDQAIGRIRSHDGVQRNFHGLLRSVSGGPERAATLSRLYAMKQPHDYDVAASTITMMEAADALTAAHDLIDFCTVQIDYPAPELSASAQNLSTGQRNRDQDLDR